MPANISMTNKVNEDITKKNPGDFCACGSQLYFSSCCQPLHKRDTIAMTAEQLMRSRYSAFVHQALEYLLFSHHKNYHRPNETEALQAVFATHKWLHLHVIKTSEDTVHQTGIVEFKACYQDKGEPNVLHACSNFIKEQSQWYYTDDTFHYCEKPEQGRNDLCWCGSGKKAKKCHKDNW